MKKSVILIISLVLFNLTLVVATCELNVTMINQDPYPAIPGDYVKLLFQMTGIENPECEIVSFELLEIYPILFDPGHSSITEIKGGTYQRDYNSYLMLPYKVRLDENALDGENQIDVKFKGEGILSTSQSKTFYIDVEDSRANFEIHIDDYSYTSKELTIEVLNIAKNDVEALTLEIPKQDNIDIRGTNRIVVGDLDSNEYTTADFKAVPKDGTIKIRILYTDQIGTRRNITETINFDSSYFIARDGESKTPVVYYILGIVIIGLIIWWVLKRKKRKSTRIKRSGKVRF